MVRKENAKQARYCAFLGIEPIKEDIIEEHEKTARSSSILDVIYSLDEVTNLPKGDYVMYLGQDVSPEVRQFIQQNLLFEIPRQTAVPEEMADALFDYMRLPDEGIHEYVERITEFEKKRVSDLKKK